MGEPLKILVNPGKPISPFIRSLTHITDAMVRNAVPETEAAAAFKAFLGDSVAKGEAMLIGHSGNYDLGFLADIDPIFTTLPYYDTYRIAAALFPQGHNNLIALAQTFADPNANPPWHTNPHRAWSDAYATGKLLFALQTYCENLPAADLAVLRAKHPPASNGVGAFLHDAVKGQGLDPTGVRVAVARVVTRTLKLRTFVMHLVRPPLPPVLRLEPEQRTL